MCHSFSEIQSLYRPALPRVHTHTKSQILSTVQLIINYHSWLHGQEKAKKSKEVIHLSKARSLKQDNHSCESTFYKSLE